MSGPPLAGLAAVGEIPASEPFASAAAAGSNFVLVNGYFVAQASAGSLTISLKTLNGAAPSLGDQIICAFPSSAPGSALPTARSITGAMTLTVPTGATLNWSGKVWLALFDDNGTLYLAVATKSGSPGIIYPLADAALGSTTAIDSGADSANVFYAASALSSKPYRVIGYMEWNSNPSGVWTTPDVCRMVSSGIATGQSVQENTFCQDSFNLRTETIPYDNSAPQSGEGFHYFTLTITPFSRSNFLHFEFQIYVAHSVASPILAALFKDSDTDAIAVGWGYCGASNEPTVVSLRHRRQALSIVEQNYKLMIGASSAGTTTFGGAAGGPLFVGLIDDYGSVRELIG